MTNRERAKLPKNWRALFEVAVDGIDVDEEFRRDYGLGVVHDDLEHLRAKTDRKHYASYRDGVWKHLGKQAVDGSSGMSHSNETSREFYRTRHFIDSKKLRKVLKTAKTSLTSEQLQAIENVGYVAQQASGAPSELFVQGYALYIKIATAKDKFVGQFPYGFKDIMDMSVFSDNPEHDLYSLETTARTEVPLLSTFIDSHWTKFEPITKESSDGEALFYDDVTYPRMFLAGVGLAYSHCAVLMQNCEADVVASLDSNY